MTFSEPVPSFSVHGHFIAPVGALHPALTGERLQEIARIIVEARQAKLNMRDDRDWPWNLGCDCHVWMLEGIHVAAEGESRSWLTVGSKRGDLDLLFFLGGADGVPIKIFRPEADGQPARTLRQSSEELRAIQQLLPEVVGTVETESALRLAVDTDARGYVSAVTLAQYSRAGEVLYTWPVWSSDPSVTRIDDQARPEGVELEEPEVDLPESESGESDEVSGGGGS